MDNQPNNHQVALWLLQGKLINPRTSFECAGYELDEAAKALKPYAAKLLAERTTIAEGDALNKLRGDIAFLSKCARAHTKEMNKLIGEFDKHQARGHFS